MRFIVWCPVLMALLLVQAACRYLDEAPGAAATSARAAATPLPTRTLATPTSLRAPNRTPSATRTPTPEAAEDADIEQSVADARTMLERVLASAALPRLEAALAENVSLSAVSGGDQLARNAAARWLRQRASGRLRIVDFQRHQHQALIIATTRGWVPAAPLSTDQVGFMLRRYDAAGAQDPEHGDWLIDTLEAE